MFLAVLVGYLRWDPLSESLQATDKVIWRRHRLEEVPRTKAWCRMRIICILFIIPSIRSADSRAFAVPSIVYNLNISTVHNIGTST